MCCIHERGHLPSIPVGTTQIDTACIVIGRVGVTAAIGTAKDTHKQTHNIMSITSVASWSMVANLGKGAK
jgi:hypothetical protein